MLIGKIKEVWRYPVKSLGGNTVARAHVHEFGIGGDRGWALFDDDTGDITSAKKIPKLLNLTAEYQVDPDDGIAYSDRIPPVAVSFPDGRSVTSAEDLNEAISAYVGRPLSLKALEPPENLEHYRMSAPPSEEEFMRAMNVQANEDGPDFSDYDASTLELLMEYICPPGTYCDVYPLHLLTTAALQHMTAESGEDFDSRRFRPNVLVETAPGIEGIAEFDWVGKSLRIGEVLLKVESRTIRCSMPAREQKHYGLEQNPKISKALYNSTNRYLGVNLTIAAGGIVNTGDEIELIG